MLSFSNRGVSSRVRIGFPSKNGEFVGVAVDAGVSVGAIVVGGLIAAGIVWLATRTKRTAEAEIVQLRTDALGA